MAEQQISPEEYEKLIKEQCPFCKIVAGKIPAKIVYEDDKAVAFLDINPASPGHTLIVPKKHYAVLPQMSDGDVAHIFKLARNISGLLFEITQRNSQDKPAGVNIVQNNGAAAGQQVPHVHVHVIPRLEGDGVIQPWQPKQMEENKLDEMQKILSANIRPVETSKSKPREIELPGTKKEENKEEKEKKKSEEKEDKPLVKHPRSP